MQLVNLEIGRIFPFRNLPDVMLQFQCLLLVVMLVLMYRLHLPRPINCCCVKVKVH